MSHSKKKIKILYFSPHADDLEFGISLTCIESLRLGNEVVEVLMTNCEYGTHRIDFKGNRLKKIRMWELDKAAKIYKKHTDNQIKIIKMGYIDGFLSLNKNTLNSVVKILRKEKPDLIFAPDPWYAIDFHNDHLNTGRLVYFAMKKLKKTELPKRVFFYYSFKTNFAIKYYRDDLEIALEALSQHKSQFSPLKIKISLLFLKIFLFFRYFKNRGFAKQVRELKFIEGIPEIHEKFNLKDKICYFFYSNWMGVPVKEEYYPTPRELGLIK